jgi:hypothetical protein
MKLFQAIKQLASLEKEIEELEEVIDKSLVLRQEDGYLRQAGEDARVALAEKINERRFLKVAIVRTNVNTGVKVKMTDGSEQQITLQELIYMIEDNSDLVLAQKKCKDIVLSQNYPVTSYGFDLESSFNLYYILNERLKYLQEVYNFVQYKQDLME